MKFLITCNHIISNDLINSKKIIDIFFGKKEKEKKRNIILDKNMRFIESFEDPIDVALIEIIDEDNIPEKKFLYPDLNYKNGYKLYEKNFFFLAGYPNNSSLNYERCISSGKIIKVDNYEFTHSLDTRVGSSGSPICTRDFPNNVIGIHQNGSKEEPINYGIFLGFIIDKLEKEKIISKKKNNIIQNYKEIKRSNNEEEELEYIKNNKKDESKEEKKNEEKKPLIYYLDNIIKKDCEFFNFLKNNRNSEYFVNSSIFDKDEYDNIKMEFKEKFKNNNFTELEKSCIGSILGMAIGDAMGARVKFMNLNYNFNEIKDMGKHPGGYFNLNPGQWTDEYSMGLCLADSLIENKGEFDPNDIMKRFILWWSCGYNNAFRFDINRYNKQSVGLDDNIRGSFYLYIQSLGKDPYTKYGNKQTSGNGSIVRNAAIPICCFRDMEKALEYAKYQSLITHQGDESAGCCKLITFIIIKILEKCQNLKNILEDLKEFKCEYESLNYLAHSKQEGNDKNRNWNWKDKNFKYSEYRSKLHPDYIGSYCMDGLAMALHVLYTTYSFKDAILKGVNLCGDADFVGSIIGQIAGAFYGLDSIPKEWIKTINDWDNNEIALRGYRYTYFYFKKYKNFKFNKIEV